ncbi:MULTISPECIES: SAM-dependent methyltransferase [unclassified Streptomyces]|uniref:SAM-dependent methyltransferase n=1 Tax=unclassified Streptomyces TaxID=2593676 RepID=UPI0011CCA592|nr:MULTISPECIES: SAM-dependent methyltransferase [unclassified Streptomyces]WSQ81686.1 SAM-dependent methyltransferase [Streptomyces sp. NBC_01213]TXS15711.1 SAM-dependent methyltransferase [Streptomyces sp. wa22]WSQ89012.1 SAM-dependent methyltransferase [Streptomyces sp. NBC_01212]WSR04983.1 SAM-dependent methyltransferase [Streptomyces sp. NBC_01208]WSR52406.1 SAM-dependent methyltransferase [Streptomyces sp. NBC_01201]
MTTGTPHPPIDTSRPHSARVYDSLLGGKDNYPVDQAVAEQLPAEAKTGAFQNRAFMNRATAWLAGEGVSQFLDIGTGIPTAPNLHQIAQRVDPRARVVYCDNDPIVLRHAEALLVSHPEGATDYVHADVLEPATIIEAARKVLDFDRPIALSLLGLLHFLPDDVDPRGIVRTLTATLAPGSYVVLSQGASDVNPERGEQGAAEYGKGGIRLALRTRAEFARFFEGLDIVEPGLVTAPEWFRGTPAPEQELSGVYVAVARIP